MRTEMVTYDGGVRIRVGPPAERRTAFVYEQHIHKKLDYREEAL